MRRTVTLGALAVVFGATGALADEMTATSPSDSGSYTLHDDGTYSSQTSIDDTSVPEEQAGQSGLLQDDSTSMGSSTDLGQATEQEVNQGPYMAQIDEDNRVVAPEPRRELIQGKYRIVEEDREQAGVAGDDASLEQGKVRDDDDFDRDDDQAAVSGVIDDDVERYDSFDEQVRNEQAGTSGAVADTGTTSRASADDMRADGFLRREAISLKPQVGVVAFQDFLGNDTSRGAAGVALDANVSNWFTSDPTPIYFGPSTGVIFSHLGSPTSNFFGSDPDAEVAAASGSNLLLIPANVKLGVNLTDNLRIAAHGGANVLYRSFPGAIASTGEGTLAESDDAKWSVYPNVGADVDFGLAPNIGLSLRPDFTITPGADIFSGMLGLGIALG